MLIYNNWGKEKGKKSPKILLSTSIFFSLCFKPNLLFFQWFFKNCLFHLEDNITEDFDDLGNGDNFLVTQKA